MQTSYKLWQVNQAVQSTEIVTKFWPLMPQQWRFYNGNAQAHTVLYAQIWYIYYYCTVWKLWERYCPQQNCYICWGLGSLNLVFSTLHLNLPAVATSSL